MTLHAREEFIRTRTGALVTILIQKMEVESLHTIRERTPDIVKTAHGIAVQMANLVAILDVEEVVQNRSEVGDTVAP